MAEAYINQAFFCEAKGFSTRALEIPPTEATLKGPREGFTENLDDYTENKFIAFFGRLLRWIAFFAPVLLPGLYVALFCYHFKIVPYVFPNT